MITKNYCSTKKRFSLFKDIKLYFENFEKKFGPYQVAKKRTPFNPAMLEQYIAKMMNGKQDLGQSNGSNGKGDQFEASINDLIDRFQSKNSSLSQANGKAMVVDLSGDGDDTLNSPEKVTFQEDSMGQEHTEGDVMDVGTEEQDKVEVNTEERVDSPSHVMLQHAENVDKPKPLKFILKRANNSPNNGKQTKRVRFSLEVTPKYTQIKSAEGGEPDSTNGDDDIGNDDDGSGNGSEENGNGGDETGNGNGTGTADGTDNGDDNKTTQTVAEIPSAEFKDEPSNNAKYIDLMPNLQTICEKVENLLKANAELESKLTEAKNELKNAEQSRKEVENIHKKEVKLLNEKVTNLEANIVEIQKEKVEEVERAIEDTKTDCETKSSKLIAEAKKKVYCVSCGTEKHELFACNNECWKDYW